MDEVYIDGAPAMCMRLGGGKDVVARGHVHRVEVYAEMHSKLKVLTPLEARVDESHLWVAFLPGYVRP